MAKCSQCLHWDACSMLFEIAMGRKPTANGNKAEEKCPHFKDKTINTNADRIRAMSDEELAKFMNLCGHDFPPYCDVESSISGECDQNCIKCAEEWIKQPAE